MSAKTSVVRTRKGRDRKGEIVRSARELFLKNGYRLTTVEQIARHAGYSKRSVYLDFLNKDDLFITIAIEGLVIISEKLRKIADAQLPFERFIECFLDAVTVFSHEHYEYFRMLTSEVTPEIIATCSEAVKNHALEIEESGIRMLADAIEEAMRQKIILPGDPWEIAEIFIGSVVGIIVLSTGGSQAMLSYENMKTKVRKMGHIVFRGLRS
jgi:AcrR family transcriptional regulator